MRLLTATLTAVVFLIATQAQANPVGERHRVVPDETAALRDAGHSGSLRVTIW